jgi:iron complex outermembrane receptor protein
LKIQTARQRLLASTMISGALLTMAAVPANAQEREATQVDAVVVTGSRIVRQDFQAISPVTTVGSEQLELTATVSVETLLNELPQVIPGNMRTSNNAGGEEFATIDLRGLGANRTLILINGERVPPSSTTGAVDINTIPASLINRVEVVTGGASAVYGSDAISGVVNFILKDNFEGAELTATYGASFDGFAPEYEINALIGGNFDNGRGNLTAFASYYNRDQVSQSEMDYSRTSAAVMVDADGNYVPVDSAAEGQAILAAGGLGVLQPGGSGTGPWGHITNSATNPFQNLSALGGNFAAGIDRNCNGVGELTPYNTGDLSWDSNGALASRNIGGLCAIPDRSAGSSMYNFAPENLLITPAERFTIAAIGHYDITDSVRFDYRLNYTNTSQTVELAATPATGLQVHLTDAMVDLISTEHPDLYAALNTRADPTAPFTMAYRTTQLGPRASTFENNALAMVGTLSGDFGDFIPWDWSLTASYGVNNSTAAGRNSANKTAFNQGLAGCQNSTRVGGVVDSSPLGGAAVPGCVPLDIFGQGNLTPEMIAFLTVPTFSQTEIEEIRLAGFMRGDLFELPAGPVAAVFGFEYRETNAVFDVDDMQRTGNIYGFNAIQPQAGSIDVMEFYTEVSVPILADMPFADYLGVEAGYRFSDYNLAGELETWKIGAEYAPWSWLRFRSVYNVAARAPSVFELFQNGDQGFSPFVDPCRDTPQRTADMLTFCQLQAPLANFAGFTATNSQVEVFSFGNPTLLPETAETFSFGAVFQPANFPVGDFRASVDYYDISIEDVVAGRGVGFFLASCYDGTATGGPAADCARLRRNQDTGQLQSADVTIANGGTYETSGVDVQVEWSYNLDEVGLPGRLRINNLFSYIDSIGTNGSNWVGTTTGQIGSANYDYKNVLSAYYNLGDWTVFGRWSYVPEIEDGVFGGNYLTGAPTYGPAASYVDASVRWDVNDSLSLTAFVGNLFDEGVPQTPFGAVYGQANTDVQVYRVLGRTFSISAKARF